MKIAEILTCECCGTTKSVAHMDSFGRVACAYCIARMNKRIEFVQKCGELLNMAMPNLIKCELKLGRDIAVNSLINEQFIPNSEYVLVTCENGYVYTICVEANSLASIAEEIFKNMKHK